ncbi:hypothetical protein IVB08_26590 [Bradyrhizobium sp. 173]|uniref:MltR family transcriptional regulator n=1 Tax=Bradyrhizobium sp. 173 TaxID=2782644 RepID=UPI001FFA3ADC|nr:MltR family transcriptional regulator [Bradyrhizobium sp. 173]MCK1567483.1 hypothetical protein [Bradyrhizobium sp. 173]
MPEKPRGGVTVHDVEQFVFLHKLLAKGHASEVLLTAAILDQELRGAILQKMRPDLSEKKQERLFEGYGPLAEFAAKIEVAYALGQINEDIYAKLRIIKDIRNKFAHLPRECTFWTGDISELVAKFQCKEKATHPQIFGMMAEECFDHLARKATEATQ